MDSNWHLKSMEIKREGRMGPLERSPRSVCFGSLRAREEWEQRTLGTTGAGKRGQERGTASSAVSLQSGEIPALCRWWGEGEGWRVRDSQAWAGADEGKELVEGRV